MLQSTNSGATPQLEVDGRSTVTEHVRKKAKSARAKEPSRRGRKVSRTLSDLTPEARLAFSQRFNSPDNTVKCHGRKRLSRGASDSTPETTDEEEDSEPKSTSVSEVK